MTRGEFKQQSRQLLGEVRGTAGGDNDLLYDTLCNQVQDKICLETDCLYGPFVGSLVANQAEYCEPRLYKIKAVLVLDEASEWRVLPKLTPRQADRHFGSRWRNADAEAVPRYAVIGGAAGPVLFAPPPLTSRTDGFRLDGFYTPGDVWGYDGSGAAVAVTDSTESPLPVWAQPAVPYGIAYQRCLQFPSPENQARMGGLAAEFERWLGNIGQRAARHFDQEVFGQYPRLTATPF
jgi:hypothetical protein